MCLYFLFQRAFNYTMFQFLQICAIILLMNTKCYEKLEYIKMLETVSMYAVTYLGKDLSLNMFPFHTRHEVETLLQQTLEATTLIYKKGNLPISEIANNDYSLKIIESNSSLGIVSLLDLNKILILARTLKEYLTLDKIDYEPLHLSPFLNELYTNSEIEQKICTSITDENTIADNASPSLKEIRKKKRNISDNIQSKLTSMIHSSTYSKYMQEPLVTIKNSRYVIPVKQEYRSFVKGFVHDISSSGATVFIEPLSVFDLNNDLTTLDIEEKNEIEKILFNLSSLLFPIVDQLRNNIEIIAKLDFIFAKAKYSISINGVIPSINNAKSVNLIKAKHPFIDQDKVVPIDINIGNSFSTLVITGPNTGGKTVCMKTLGLLLLMAYSGILLPCSEQSSICIFDQIFCDIGDEQNIAESVSTFSSHILNIIDITKKVTSNSLVILDELGSGTDPIEGSALAISILEHFYKTNCLTIATTHYKEVKDFTLVTPGFFNASFEFDLTNLKPTYKLLMGVPGKSNAFEISTKLGLSSSILSNATKYLKPDSIQIEELLKKIYDDKKDIEVQKENIFKQAKQTEDLKNKLEKDLSRLEEKELKILEKAKQEAREILLSAKEQLTIVSSQIKSTKDLDKKRSDINSTLKTLNSSIPNYNISETSDFEKKDIFIGMEVFISSFQKTGIVLTLPNNSNEVNISIGNIKVNLNINTLSKPNKNSTNVAKQFSTKQNLSKSKTISTELNIIGLNVEEAIPIVDKYLDDAYISSIASVRIVHGKGTGALRKGIHSFLKTHHHVADFRIGTFGEGEMGVTVVTLK